MPWVDKRENTLLDIMSKLVPLQTAGTIKTLDRNPIGKITAEEMDAVYLFEGQDNIIQNVKRDVLGPQQRNLSLVAELWVYQPDISLQSNQLRNLYNEVRKAILLNTGLFERSLTSVYTTAVPGVLGVGLVMDLKYINDGN